MIDLSADFRLKDAAAYSKWYGLDHAQPNRLAEFVYGNVELHREEMKQARYISGAGCNATATILPLWPLFKQGVVDTSRPVIAEAKCGSSEGGNSASEASHHPERSGCVRSYKPTGHRHIAEMEQELGQQIHFSATSIEMVRGILTTAHLFVAEGTTEKDIWQTYRRVYGQEPFIRIVKEKQGIYRFPEPKILVGTNYCDIGFELAGTRLVVISAIDNLMKGAAGQAVHAMNVMCGFEETDGLGFAGLHPV
jgi:N-acetyl-gamma-glutamyl-phosphate/LysW-gamma-L-alpha-aminoadipyl-6-phosphate reductase